jgi:hypothetical protein
VVHVRGDDVREKSRRASWRSARKEGSITPIASVAKRVHGASGRWTKSADRERRGEQVDSAREPQRRDERQRRRTVWPDALRVIATHTAPRLGAGATRSIRTNDAQTTYGDAERRRGLMNGATIMEPPPERARPDPAQAHAATIVNAPLKRPPDAAARHPSNDKMKRRIVRDGG